MNRIIRCICLAFSLGACALPTAPYPPGAVEFTPLPWYGEVWKEIEACSGKTRRMGDIRWMQVPDVIWFMHRGEKRSGLYYPHHTVLLAGLVTDLREIVGHEVLHAVRYDKGNVHDAKDGMACAAYITGWE
jgi:hypothetical protein